MSKRYSGKSFKDSSVIKNSNTKREKKTKKGETKEIKCVVDML